MTKKLSFYLIAFSLPFAALFLLEASLRLFSYGNDYPLFVKHNAIDGYLQTNPDVIKRFFSIEADAPTVSPDTFIFAAKKPKNSIRIVTMGGSSMAGYPYGRFGSPAGMLDQRIKAQHPNLNIDVISVAMSAINSYAILDFADEVAAIEPDAVLIYAGHNEYLGIMGASSNLSANASRESKLLFLALKRYKVYQFVADIISLFRSSSPASIDGEATGRTLMAQVAQSQTIPYQSDTYHAGLTQFRDNMKMVFDVFSARNIPVFISSIAANEKDQKPFVSAKNSALEKTIDVINARPARAKFLLDKPVIQQANAAKHAQFMFTMGTALFQDNKPDEALAFFTKAMDYDQLRFRAPSELNNAIKRLTENTPATFVDALGALRKQSTAEGVIGNQLMLEHLHPNVTGYFWIAEAFYDALLTADLLPPPSVNVPPSQALRLQPVSSSEQLHAQHNIQRLLSDYPFTNEPKQVTPFTPRNAIEEVALARIEGQAWIANQQQLFNILQQQKSWLDAAIVAGNLYQAIPNQPQLANVAAKLFLRTRTWGLAEYYARQATATAPMNTSYLLTLAEILFKSGQRDLALNAIDNVLTMDPDNQIANQLKQQL